MDITTELKLKIAQLKKEMDKTEAKYIGLLREDDTLISSLMLDVALYKNKIKRIKTLLEILKEKNIISEGKYFEYMEWLND